MRVTMEGAESVGIKWLKQRTLEKPLEAGIRRALSSARKAVEKTKVSPAGTLAWGSGGAGKGPWSAVGSPRLRLPWSEGSGAGKGPLPQWFRTFVPRSTALREAGERMGRDLGDCCCPENAGLCHPGAEAAVGALPLLRGRIFFGCAAGEASLTSLPAHDWGPCQPFGSLRLLRVAPS